MTTPATPPAVITIDPEDTAQIQRLATIIGAALGGVEVPVDRLQTAARRFVTPRPDEPTGLGAVVEDSTGCRWTRYAVANIVEAWISDEGARSSYADIDAVHVYSGGLA